MPRGGQSTRRRILRRLAGSSGLTLECDAGAYSGDETGAPGSSEPDPDDGSAGASGASPSGVSPIIPEELSVLRGGKLMIAAGQGGIVVPYDAIPPDWDFEDDGLWPPVNAVVEYSPDGRQWSRSVLPGETGSTVEIVGTTTVLLRERGIYIGTAES